MILKKCHPKYNACIIKVARGFNPPSTNVRQMTIIPEEVIFYFIYSFFDFGKIVVLYAQEFQGWHEKPDPKNPKK